MDKKYKILLIDCEIDRRLQLTTSLQCCTKYLIDSRSHIERNIFENSSYDIVFVHASNKPEGSCVENEEWDAGAAKVVLFSGGYSQDIAEYEGFTYLRASYVENQDNLQRVLRDMLKI